ncbi:STAS domain-containing protein [Streptomyces sp. NPDC055287]
MFAGGARLVVAPAVVEKAGAVLPLSGELDMDGEALLTNAVENLLSMGTRQVILDCSRLTFCDSRGFNALLAARQQVQDAGGDLALAGATDRVQDLLFLVGGDLIFTTALTVDEARSVLTRAAVRHHPLAD